MHTSVCFKTVIKCKIPTYWRFKFKDFQVLSFKHLICFQALSRALHFFFQNSNIFKDFSSTPWTLAWWLNEIPPPRFIQVSTRLEHTCDGGWLEFEGGSCCCCCCCCCCWGLGEYCGDAACISASWLGVNLTPIPLCGAFGRRLGSYRIFSYTYNQNHYYYYFFLLFFIFLILLLILLKVQRLNHGSWCNLPHGITQCYLP